MANLSAPQPFSADLSALPRRSETVSILGAILVLPWPPTANTYWRSVMIGGRQRVLISEGGRRFRRAVAEQVLIQRPTRFGADRVRVEVDAHPPDLRIRDLGNLDKALQDALTHAGVWTDDSQIDEYEVVRMPPYRSGGAVVVRIYRLELQ